MKGITENTRRTPSSLKSKETACKLLERLKAYRYRDAREYVLLVLKLSLAAVEAGRPVRFEAMDDFPQFTRVLIELKGKSYAWWIPVGNLGGGLT